MIDRARIESQIVQTEQERVAALETLQRCDGVLLVCRHWLAELQNEDAVASAQAEANGVPAEVN